MMKGHASRFLFKEIPKPIWFLAVVFLFLSVQSSFAAINITPVTWNVVGLDSNNVNAGPNVFPVGARICNTGASAVSNVTTNLIWDTSNAYINLDIGAASSINFGSLAAGRCLDSYFDVAVSRTSAAYNATRRYRITASADGQATVGTPTGREIYVEKLVSQNRNSVLGITGPSTVYVGQTYQYTIDASTATNGYEQLEAFLSLSNVIFRILSVSTTYSAPTGGTNDKIYADACGWQNNPTGASYRDCVGPENYSGAKAGGTVRTTYTVLVMSTGVTTAATMIYDFSGSSYHYNADYGEKIISIAALPALAPDLTLAKSHTGNFPANSTGTYTLTVSNAGTALTAGAITVTDTLPTGLSVTVGTVTPGGTNGGNWTCSANAASPQVITCTSSTVIGFTSGSNTSVFTLTVNVAANAPSSVTNNASVSGGGEPAANSGNNTASDATTIVSPPNIALVKTCSSPANCESAVQLSGTELTYAISFINSGGQGATNFSIVDPNPAIATLKLNNNTDFKIGSVTNTLGTTGLTATVTYSNNSGVSFVYTPVSAGGGAPAGYDRSVTHIRWAFTGTLSQTAPNNTGNVSFVVRIR
jgi:uncharacterized repeat protein (TIGR01451 family)